MRDALELIDVLMVPMEDPCHRLTDEEVDRIGEGRADVLGAGCR